MEHIALSRGAWWLQDALNKVHVRVHEHNEGDQGAPPPSNNLVTRMLVCHTQAGSIIGK